MNERKGARRADAAVRHRAAPPISARLVRGRQVHGAFLAVAAHFDVVVETLVLIEGLHPASLDSRDVDEAVVRTIVGLDKAIA